MNTSIKTVKTTCCYCGVGCGINASLDSHDRLRVEGDPDHPTNRGMLCSKGRYLNHVVSDHSQRLLYPAMRHSRAHPMERVSWDTALERTARVFRSIIERHGPDSVGLYVSGQLLTEEYYIANKLMKGFIGSNNIDTNSRLCMSSAVAGYKQAFGDDLVPIAYEDIEQSDCLFITGANPAWCHPILFRRIEEHKSHNPTVKIIVVDPRATDTTILADLHLQITPGTDITLYNAIARCLIESNDIDDEFIAAHVDDFDALGAHVMRQSVDEAAQICTVPAADIRLAATYIGKAKAFLSMWAMGLNQSAEGVNKNVALLNLSLITGQIGKPGSGPFSLTGQPNAMGGREVGGLSNLLAAHRDLNNPDERAFVSEFWGSGDIAPLPGRTATEMFDALESGEMKAIWIVCTNPAVSMPNLKKVLKGLKKSRFVVVQDISAQTDTVEYADVVFPAAGWLEKSGTMTNSERRVSHLSKLVDAPGEALPDVNIFCRFADKMGWGDSFTYADESEIYAEHVALTRGTRIDQSGLSHARLHSEGTVQWPCPNDTHPGTTRLFEDGKFPTVSGNAKVFSVESMPNVEQTSEEKPYILTTGRIRDQWHTMTKTGSVSRLKKHLPKPFLEIHPDDAESLGLREDDSVKVSNEYGEAHVSVQVTPTIKRGVVFMPMHWGRKLGGDFSRANNLTSPRIDPVSKEPDFKYSTVAIQRMETPKRRIAVVGTGAAGLEFTRHYRTLNDTDTLHVFGDEADSFYNRILLPEYISKERPWNELQSLSDELRDDPRITIHSGSRVAHINRKDKRLTDEHGNEYDYDTLIMATGSRARVPADFPIEKNGVFTLRNRGDADRIQSQAQHGKNAIILGGGLLGVEIADALSAMGLTCTIIHRSDTLLRTMLDATGSRMVKHALESRGIECLMQDGIVKTMGEDTVTGVRTLSGTYLPCDLLIATVGIEANLHLAQDSELSIRRAILVNDVMQTSDPSIFAIGEVAEHANIVYGTSLAAQEQARVAAAHIAGKKVGAYAGTVSFSVLKVRDLQVASVGIVVKQSPDWEEAIALDETIGYYKKCFVHQGRLMGAILVGTTSELPQIKQWIEEKLELDQARMNLVTGMGDSTASVPRGKVVCACVNVGEDDIQECLDLGAKSLDDVCSRTHAGSGCGSCRPALMRMINDHIAHPVETCLT